MFVLLQFPAPQATLTTSTSGSGCEPCVTDPHLTLATSVHHHLAVSVFPSSGQCASCGYSCVITRTGSHCWGWTSMQGRHAPLFETCISDGCCCCLREYSQTSLSAVSSLFCPQFSPFLPATTRKMLDRGAGTTACDVTAGTSCKLRWRLISFVAVWGWQRRAWYSHSIRTHACNCDTTEKRGLLVVLGLACAYAILDLQWCVLWQGF